MTVMCSWIGLTKAVKVCRRMAGRFVVKTKPARQINTMQTDTRLIPLTQGKFAIVDAIDYDWLMQWKWYAVKGKNTRGYYWYAKRTEKGPGQIRITMQRAVAERAGIPSSKLYDHIDRDGLNNSRENIRPCTRRQNSHNRTKSSGASSRFKGVHRNKIRNKWQSSIRVDGKPVHLGLFTDEQEASEAYIVAARFYFGEFAS